MTTDQELLRRYVQDSSEEAFAELVRRHVNLVYGSALRQLCGNASLSQDVTQAVFTALATRARDPGGIHRLSSWLFATTRFTVSHTVRSERRRQDREKKAHSLNTLLADSATSDAPSWPPGLVDEVLEALDEGDREAVLLRYFEGQSFAAIGIALRLGEDAARMRVNRAIERTRGLFAKRGITSSAAAIGAAFTEQSVAAPPSLAASAAAGASSASAAIVATSGAKAAFFAGAGGLKAAALAAGCVALLALAYSVHEHRAASRLQEREALLDRQRGELQASLDRSEQRARALEGEASLAAERTADLQQRLDAVPAAKPARVPMASANGLDAQTADRLARMKPLLEGGMPIKGAVVVMQEGTPVQLPVQFVMGKETRIDAADDGTYIVTPTMNPDGTVKYSMQLLERDLNGGPDKSETLPFVIQTPWAGFTISEGGGRVIAFDPDSTGP